MNKTNIKEKVRTMLNEIPIWPIQIQMKELAKRHGVPAYNLPTNAPLAEDDGYVCWPDDNAKHRFLEENDGRRCSKNSGGRAGEAEGPGAGSNGRYSQMVGRKKMPDNGRSAAGDRRE